MLGPYIGGLGLQNRRRSKSSSSDDEHEETQHKNEEESFVSNGAKRRRVSPTDAELIPKFRPDDKNTHVIRWLHKIDQLGDVYGWCNEDRQYIMQLRLRGSARDWYNDLDSYDLDWPGWKNALQTAFPRSIDFVDRLEEMLARTKTNSETMTKYYHEKLSMLKKCNITGEQAISCIIRGLPRELQANAKAYNCDTPEQLYFGYLSSLENFKRVEETHATRKSTWRKGDQNTSSGTTAQRLLPKVCYACRRPGHEIKDCRSQQRCQVCQRAGHTTATCWFGANSSRSQPQKVTDSRENYSDRRETRPMQDGRVLSSNSGSGTSQPGYSTQ